MEISLNWLRQYVDLPKSVAAVADMLTSLGLEVEGTERVLAGALSLDGVLVGEVLTCEQHPDADRLRLTTVIIGADTPLQIVCGAPNVAAGQKVAVATIGAEVMGAEGTFVIKKGKIRGAASEGMLCALDELALGSDHSGILVLPAQTPVGQLVSEALNLENDTVISIGLTPNRADAMCHLGVARDLAAALRVREGQTSVLRPPSVAHFPNSANAPASVEVTAPDPALCERYAGVVIRDIVVGASPEWLQKRLQAVGQRSINNVVDATNFVMLELGQPLHAFDYTALGSPAQIKVQTLAAGTLFFALDGQEIKLHPDDIMICNGQNLPLCLAGVFGGIGSGVQSQTTSIFLESAVFNAKSVRKSSQRHNFRTESATRFEKGVDPNTTLFALQRCALLIVELAGGQILTPIVDFYPHPKLRPEVAFSWKAFNNLVGVVLPETEVLDVLQALDFKILSATLDTLQLAIPTDKPDVLRAADVTEEILRVYGYDRIPGTGEVRFSLPSIAAKPLALAPSATALLNGLGFHEAMGLSLTDVAYFENASPEKQASLVLIQNTANRNLNALRPSLLYGLLEAAAYNLNRKQSQIRLFEFGNTYLTQGPGKYVETARLGIVLGGPKFEENWLQTAVSSTSIYDLKSAVTVLFNRLGIKGVQQTTVTDHEELFPALALHTQGVLLGHVGQVNNRLKKQFDIKTDLFFGDLDWKKMQEEAIKTGITFREISKFPSVSRDLAIILKKETKFADVERIALKAGQPLLQHLRLFDVYEDETKLGADFKSYALNFRFESDQQTLIDKDIERVMEKIEKSLQQQLQATVRR